MSKDTIETENQMALFGLPEKPKTAPAEAKITKSPKSKPVPPQSQPPMSVKKTAPKKAVVAAPPPPPQRGRSGLVPEGDVRLTANIREDLHLRLKIAAAKKRTTIGEIIEDLVDKYVE